MKAKLRLTVLVVLIVAALGLSICLYLAGQVEIAELRAEIARMREQESQYRRAIGEVAAYKELESELVQVLRILDHEIAPGPGPVLEHLGRYHTDDIRMTAFELDRRGISMQGEAINGEIVHRVFDDLGDLGDQKVSELVRVEQDPKRHLVTWKLRIHR